MNSVYKHIIFDLDGTLSDSREGIFNAYYHVFDRLNLKYPDRDTLMTLIGPPLQKGFEDVFGLRGSENENAVKVFREYYASKGLFENILYDGIPKLLERLIGAGALLYVATAKYHPFASQVLRHFAIDAYFADVSGADYSGHHASKTELVARILRKNNIMDPMEVVMIGDTRYDMEAAAELEMDSIGVTYGFSTKEEIISFDPDYTAGSVEELEHILLQE
ncbi:MAG: HAD hydrolase-like protein [Bacteroidales bacterium]|nr:HAD hydrolase-like protein [Bacteroidales bacterium]